MSTDLTNLSIEELEALKRQRYEEAQRAGIPAQVATVAREFGRDPVSMDHPGYVSSHGPKYRWDHEEIRVYVDDFGGYMTVHVNGTEVCSTHFCDRRFIPGPWVDVVLACYPEAKARIAAREQQRQDEQRKRLLVDLGAE